MAGDWIKMQHATPDKPEVMKMAKILGIQPEQVVGHLVRVWSWADQQSLNGHALDVTEEDVDRVSRHASVTVMSHDRRASFASAMRQVGWLKGVDGSMSFPNFDRHNGESAKKRALASDRKRLERDRKSRGERDEDVTRGEESIEEGTTPISPPVDNSEQQQHNNTKGVTREARRTRLELTELPDSWRVWAGDHHPGVDAVAQFARFRDHHVSKGSLMADWPAAWRTWCGRAVEFGPKGGKAPGAQLALEARNAKVAAGWQPPEEQVES